MSKWIESGPPSAPVWIVAEAPGEQEVANGRPLCGPSGQELIRMLREAGWPEAEAFTSFFKTNICHERPPSYQKRGKTINNDIDQFFATATAARKESLDLVRGRYPRPPILRGLERLRELARLHSPTLIIALGNTALWGLCGHSGITKWRGSTLLADRDFGAGPSGDGIKVLATLHPAVIVDPVKGQYTYRPVVIQDFRRALRESAYPEVRRPVYRTLLRPTLEQCQDWFSTHLGPLVCDTEGYGVVDCIGFAASSTDAICIPFRQADQPGSPHYWTEAKEVEVFALVKHILTSRDITFHNGTWDMQVIAKNWGYLPRMTDDTMVMQHCLFPGLLGGKIDPVTGAVDKRGSSLSLSFCASMYCSYYRFWKDDGRHRNPDATDDDEWAYNAEDCLRTYEIRDSLLASLASSNLTSQYRFLMSLFKPVLDMMFRGLRLDRQRVLELRSQIHGARREQSNWLRRVLGHDINVHASHAGGQLQQLFYNDLRCAPVLSRKTGAVSTDDDSLETLCRKQPLLVPLIRHVQNIRSLDANESNFIEAALQEMRTSTREEREPRWRSTLAIPGAETFRFTSSETAFGEGRNLQNLTRPPED